MASVAKREWTYKGEQRESWVVRYTDQGGKRRLKTFEKKKDADRERARIETDVLEGTHVAASQTRTLGEAIDAWLADCKRRWLIKDQMAGNTLYGYECKAKLIPPELRLTKLTALTSVTVQCRVNEWAQRYSRRTISMLVSCVNLSLQMAVRNQWLKVNPLAQDRVRLPFEEKKEARIPTLEEMRVLLMVCGTIRKKERNSSAETRALLVVLGVFAGLRRSEMCGLQWSDVDFERGEITIRHSYSWIDKLKSPKSEAGKRVIPMAAPVRETLLRVRGERRIGDGGFVMVTSQGNPIWPQKIGYFHWLPLMKDAGLVKEKIDKRGRKIVSPLFGVHALRHAHASLLIAHGLSAFRTSRILGHSKIEITMNTYGHLFAEDRSGHEAIEQMQGQIGLQNHVVVDRHATRQQQKMLSDCSA